MDEEQKTFWEYCAEVAALNGIGNRRVVEDIETVARCFDVNHSINFCAGTIEGRRMLVPEI